MDESQPSLRIERRPVGDAEGAPVAWIWMARPTLHNAFDEGLIAALDEAFATLDADAAVRVIVLAGEGRSFSAGADLRWMQRQGEAPEADNLDDARERARLLAFLGAVEQGVQYLLNYPEESWKLFVKGRERELDNELNRRAWRDTIPRFTASPAALDTQRYKRFAAFLLASKVIDKAPPVSAYAVDLGAR